MTQRAGAGAAGPGWYADPTGPGNPARGARERFWDGRAWGADNRPATGPAPVARFFHGRFRGRWLWWSAASALVLTVGGGVYLRHPGPALLAAVALAATILAGLGFAGFAGRQLLLRQVVGPAAALLTAAGTVAIMFTLTLATNLWVLATFGVGTVLLTVGPVEELSKLLVPLLLWRLRRFRDPRAGIVLGLASGMGFATGETAVWAAALRHGGALNVCTGQALPAQPAAMALAQVVARMLITNPFHWLLTGIATTLIWLAWHRAGRARLVPAAVVVVLVSAAHSGFDGGVAASACGGTPRAVGVAGLVWLVPLLLYAVFKAAARQSLPPELVGAASLGWHPRSLPGAVARPAPPGGLPADGLPAEEPFTPAG